MLSHYSGLLLLAPAALVLVCGAVLAPLAALAPADAVRRGCKQGAAALGAVVAATIFCALALPRQPVSGGPVGATCPAVGGFAGSLLDTLAIASLGTGVLLAATAIAAAVGRRQAGLAAGVAVLAVVLPYLALAAWVAPRLCDYS